MIIVDLWRALNKKTELRQILRDVNAITARFFGKSTGAPIKGCDVADKPGLFTVTISRKSSGQSITQSDKDCTRQK